MSFYYKNWKLSQHIIIPYLHNHFSAFSEEKGESSIHQLLTQINDFKYDIDIFSSKYQNVAAYMGCAPIFDFKLSYKETIHSKYSISNDTYNPNSSDDQLMDNLTISIQEYFNMIKIDKSFYIFKLSQSYSNDTEMEHYENYCSTLIENFEKNILNYATTKLSNIPKLLQKKYVKPDEFPIDIPTANWQIKKIL